MEALSWIGVVLGLALAASWMMLSCIVAGLMLRFSHQRIIASHWFALARRYGLLGALWRSPAIAVRRAIRRSSRSWNVLYMAVLVVATGVLVAAVGFIAAYALPGIVPSVFIPGSVMPAELRDLLGKTAIIAGCFGALTAMDVWARGLTYVAKPTVSHSFGPPSLRLPPGLNCRARYHLSLNVYWYNRIQSAVRFSAIYPLLFPILLAASSPQSSSGASSASSSAASQSDGILLATALLVLALLPSLLPSMTLGHLIEKRMISAKVSLEISQLLDPAEQIKPDPEIRHPGLIGDPLGRRRWGLAQITGDLADAARQLDARQPRGLPPHPIATLLRAASRSVRQFLGNQCSLRGSLPGDLTEILEMTLAILGFQHDEAIYDRLAKQTGAFDGNGDPAVELTGKPPGRLAALANQTITGTQKLTLVITSIATIIAILIAIILVLLHRMNVSQLLPYLR